MAKKKMPDIPNSKWTNEAAYAMAEEFAQKAKASIETFTKNLKQESDETTQMAQSFFRLLSNKLNLDSREEPPTPEEVRRALEQLKDVGRVGIFATISLIPGGAFSLIGLEILARKFGIEDFTLVPSSFQNNRHTKNRNGNVSND
jgi:hypothetical protein